jgi:hypothetical protein
MQRAINSRMRGCWYAKLVSERMHAS